MNVENQPLVDPSKIFVAIHAFKAWFDKKILWRPWTKKKLPLLTYEKSSPD
jgi:hypothetical protein